MANELIVGIALIVITALFGFLGWLARQTMESAKCHARIEQQFLDLKEKLDDFISRFEHHLE